MVAAIKRPRKQLDQQVAIEMAFALYGCGLVPTSVATGKPMIISTGMAAVADNSAFLTSSKSYQSLGVEGIMSAIVVDSRRS